jgi:hypothetical protein
VSRVYVRNDGNGPLVIGVLVVIVILVLLWWLLFANGGGPAPTVGPGAS